jgi:hypothetical protein
MHLVLHLVSSRAAFAHRTYRNYIPVLRETQVILSAFGFGRNDRVAGYPSDFGFFETVWDFAKHQAARAV